MPDAVRDAVILAAGRGTRMGGMTVDLPKPMLPIHGKPMLEHVLDSLAAAGIERFVIVVGYHREVIENHFKDWRLPITFCLQEEVNGTAKATLLAADAIGDRPFLLTFGDIICPPEDYVRCNRTLIDNPNTLAVLGVKDVDDPWRGAAVYEKDYVVSRIIEKPPPGTSTTRWNSAGLFTLQPVAFEYLRRVPLSPRNEYELTSIFEMMLNEGREVRISPILGEWRDVGTPEDLAAMNRGPE